MSQRGSGRRAARRCVTGTEVHPKTLDDASLRLTSGSKRAPNLALMTTEYQERFIPPCCYKTIVTTMTQKNPYHSLKSTRAEKTIMGSFYVTQKWKINPSKPPLPSVQPEVQQNTYSIQPSPSNPGANYKTAKQEDYTTVYNNDFRAWKIKKRQPFKMVDSLKVSKGLFPISTASNDGPFHRNSAAVDSKPVPRVQQPEPYQGITSYKSDYVVHPVQPRIRRVKLAYQPTKGLLPQPAASPKSKDHASGFSEQFKSWSLESNHKDQGIEWQPEDEKFKTKTHADYTAHQHQHTNRFVPHKTTRERSEEPFHVMTTMKEDYKAWNVPRQFRVKKEELDRPKKTNLCTPEPAESSKTNPKPFRPCSNMSRTATCSSNGNVSQEQPLPAENGVFQVFECISNGNEESRTTFMRSDLA